MAGCMSIPARAGSLNTPSIPVRSIPACAGDFGVPSFLDAYLWSIPAVWGSVGL